MDRAEAIKILVRSRPAFDIGKNTVFTDAYEMAIAALREQEQSKWISVKERLPEANRLVLCWWQSGDGEREHYGFARYQSHGVWYVSNEGMPNVTHWMPLPEPPEVQPSEVSPSGNVNRKEGADHE